MSLKIGSSLLIISILFIGCAAKPEIDIDTTPKMQVPKKSAPIIKRKGTLYSKKGASLFADKKDLQIGDIIQVLISETLTNDSTNSRETKKDNSNSLGGGVIAPIGENTLATGTQKRVDKFNNSFGVGFNTTSSSSFKGSAKSAADEEFTTVISAIIEQTYQNGNYFIKGSKEMLINGQKQNIKISGVIRPYDISPDNTVNSNQLANLKILYIKDGEENDALNKPWGTKLIETIWPF
ncbi:MAG: flagellar basal body L-ring protein FlgH [Campylobacterota bacterium]|nr:flagellar basal body L-ring protein FlgH [Campylobacterota bacterium]